MPDAARLAVVRPGKTAATMACNHAASLWVQEVEEEAAAASEPIARGTPTRQALATMAAATMAAAKEALKNARLLLQTRALSVLVSLSRSKGSISLELMVSRLLH